MPVVLPDDERVMLSNINARRFELLLHAARLGDAFTAVELRAAAPAQSTTSLTRDLNALEAGGLLSATPPAGQQRQGRPVHFRLAPNAVALFEGLAQRLAEASTLPRSS